MKRNLITLFATLACALALCTCENPEIIALLRAPSKLRSLEITAFAGDFALEGGAAMEPGFTASVFNYTVFVDLNTTAIAVNASLNGEGSVAVMSEEDQETG